MGMGTEEYLYVSSIIYLQPLANLALHVSSCLIHYYIMLLANKTHQTLNVRYPFIFTL